MAKTGPCTGKQIFLLSNTYTNRRPVHGSSEISVRVHTPGEWHTLGKTQGFTPLASPLHRKAAFLRELLPTEAPGHCPAACGWLHCGAWLRLGR